MHVFSKPRLIRSDPAGALRATAFVKNIEDFGLNVDKTPGEAHSKNGVCERLIGIHTETLEGLSRAHEDMSIQELFDLASWSHMHSYCHQGFTPGQLLLGATPEGLDPDPIADDPHLAQLSSSTGDAMRQTLERQASGRERHRKAIASDRLRRAAQARTRQDAYYPSGATVWYWREQCVRMIKGQIRRGGWKGPATVLIQEKRGDGTRRGIVWLLHSE